VDPEGSLDKHLIDLLEPWPGGPAVGLILQALRLLQQLRPLASQSWKNALELTYNRLGTLTLADQSFKNDLVLDTVFSELVLGHEVTEEEVHDFWFHHVALRLFLSSNLEQRIYGLSQMEKVLACGTPSAMKKLRCNIDPLLIVNWLSSCKFLELLLNENRLHSEIITRSERIVTFIAQHAGSLEDGFERFTPPLYIRFLELSFTQHESVSVVLWKSLADAAIGFPADAPHLSMLLSRLEEELVCRFDLVVDVLRVLLEAGERTLSKALPEAMHLAWMMTRIRTRNDMAVAIFCQIFSLAQKHRAEYFGRVVGDIRNAT